MDYKGDDIDYKRIRKLDEETYNFTVSDNEYSWDDDGHSINRKTLVYSIEGIFSDSLFICENLYNKDIFFGIIEKSNTGYMNEVERQDQERREEERRKQEIKEKITKGNEEEEERKQKKENKI